MRRVLVIFCMMCMTWVLKAQPVSGIQVEGNGSLILVYLDGQRVSMPTTSCFIAHLNRGHYRVEVYETRYPRADEAVWKGKQLYNQSIYFSGTGIKMVMLPSNGPSFPSHRPSGCPSEDYDDCDRVMSPSLFRDFYKEVKNLAFGEHQLKFIGMAVPQTYFTSQQCKELLKLFSFSSDQVTFLKMIYPAVVDKEAFFTVVQRMSFSSDREKVYNFIRRFNQINRH